MKDEMPETTKQHFDAATLAVLSNIRVFCGLAIEAGNRQALINLGRLALETINGSLELLDPGEKQVEH